MKAIPQAPLQASGEVKNAVKVELKMSIILLSQLRHFNDCMDSGTSIWPLLLACNRYCKSRSALKPRGIINTHTDPHPLYSLGSWPFVHPTFKTLELTDSDELTIAPC